MVDHQNLPDVFYTSEEEARMGPAPPPALRHPRGVGAQGPMQQANGQIQGNRHANGQGPVQVNGHGHPPLPTTTAAPSAGPPAGSPPAALTAASQPPGHIINNNSTSAANTELFNRLFNHPGLSDLPPEPPVINPIQPLPVPGYAVWVPAPTISPHTWDSIGSVSYIPPNASTQPPEANTNTNTNTHPFAPPTLDQDPAVGALNTSIITYLVQLALADPPPPDPTRDPAATITPPPLPSQLPPGTNPVTAIMQGAAHLLAPLTLPSTMPNLTALLNICIAHVQRAFPGHALLEPWGRLFGQNVPVEGRGLGRAFVVMYAVLVARGIVDGNGTLGPDAGARVNVQVAVNAVDEDDVADGGGSGAGIDPDASGASDPSSDRNVSPQILPWRQDTTLAIPEWDAGAALNAVINAYHAAVAVRDAVAANAANTPNQASDASAASDATVNTNTTDNTVDTDEDMDARISQSAFGTHSGSAEGGDDRRAVSGVDVEATTETADAEMASNVDNDYDAGDDDDYGGLFTEAEGSPPPAQEGHQLPPAPAPQHTTTAQPSTAIAAPATHHPHDILHLHPCVPPATSTSTTWSTAPPDSADADAHDAGSGALPPAGEGGPGAASRTATATERGRSTAVRGLGAAGASSAVQGTAAVRAAAHPPPPPPAHLAPAQETPTDAGVPPDSAPTPSRRGGAFQPVPRLRQEALWLPGVARGHSPTRSTPPPTDPTAAETTAQPTQLSQPQASAVLAVLRAAGEPTSILLRRLAGEPGPPPQAARVVRVAPPDMSAGVAASARSSTPSTPGSGATTPSGAVVPRMPSPVVALSGGTVVPARRTRGGAAPPAAAVTATRSLRRPAPAPGPAAAAPSVGFRSAAAEAPGTAPSVTAAAPSSSTSAATAAATPLAPATRVRTASSSGGPHDGRGDAKRRRTRSANKL